MSVVIETTKGDITVDLYVKERPKTCLNFLKLCKVKYYNFCRFHHIERNFLAQTGDPTGTGRGGESIYGKLYGDQAQFYEAEMVPIIKHVKPGILSMVNVGDNMLGSQFIITLGEHLDYLDKEHCAFGEVVEGHDVLLTINDAICDESHVPYQDIRITHTVVLDDPFDDPPGLGVPPQSPELTREIAESGRIAADEDIDDMAGKSAEEIEEMLADREAKARATILEMVGDIPSIDAAPPENVLFVCKLNPVTTDEDLMIIFSRFGKINCCEIIRDRQTGNSLQYAFIEFDNPKSCEDAYFKMDNVLIDDRRIHVDFSQSVSKLKWNGKGRGVNFVNGKPFDPNDHRRGKLHEKESERDRKDRSVNSRHHFDSKKSKYEHSDDRNTRGNLDSKRSERYSRSTKEVESKRSYPQTSASSERYKRDRNYEKYESSGQSRSHRHSRHSPYQTSSRKFTSRESGRRRRSRSRSYSPEKKLNRYETEKK